MRNIVLLTSNKDKYIEYQEIFSIYGLQVIQKKREDNLNDFAAYFEKDTVAVVWDESNVFNTNTSNKSKLDIDMELVYNQTTFSYTLPNNTKSSTLNKSNPIHGYIDLERVDSSSFGWDSVFVLSHLGMSYSELRKRNMKNSGRNELISKFIIDVLYYKKKIDLNFNPQEQDNSIEFNGNSIDFIRNNKYLNMPTNTKFGFTDLFNTALNNGAFFRSAKNRREKNYWLPGLNAGIPLVPKKDDIHEITFAVHDLCHFIMPDLIFDGLQNKNDFDNRENIEYRKQYKQTYVIHRMMSEAITMVFADMIFVNGLKEDGIDYDFTKRNIYPLYEKVKHNNIKDILYANVMYCLQGDDSYYIELFKDKTDLTVLENFKSKYMPFFVEDFKWTDKNFENMKSNTPLFNNWTSDLELIMDKNNLLTISDFINKKEIVYSDNNTEYISSIFNYIVNDIYMKNLEEDIQFNKEENISNSFKKYMIGQMFIFHKYDFISISKVYSDKIKSQLNKGILTQIDILNMRNLYNDYLNQLFNMNLINADDLNTYREVFPIFDSFYVFYDKDKEYYSSLKEVSISILG